MEAIRHRRLLLAVLNGATDAVAEIRPEMADCVPCLVSLAGSYLAINAGMTVMAFGGDQRAAVHAVQQVLLEYIDERNGLS